MAATDKMPWSKRCKIEMLVAIIIAYLAGIGIITIAEIFITMSMKMQIVGYIVLGGILSGLVKYYLSKRYEEHDP